MNAVLAKGIFVGGLTGLLFGFDTAVIAGATHGLSVTFGLGPAGLGATVSSALWGTFTGALIAGYPGDRFGARNCLRVIAAMYLLSALGSFLAPTLALFIAARVLGGLAIGASTVLAPTYLAEIAPADRRGALVGVFQLNIVFGILVAYLSNYLIGVHLGAPDAWRWKFLVAVFPAALLGAQLFTIPNSPRWLAVRGRNGEAADVLGRIGVRDVAAELNSYSHADRPASGALARLSWRRHARPMLLAMGIAAFNQLSGINAILYYLNDIFAAAGFGRVSAAGQAVLIGATNLVFTLLALAVIDRFGRRTLLKVGSLGLIVSLAATAYIELSGAHQQWLLWMLVLFIASFAFSQGAVIWVYIAEIFPTEVRSRGQGLGASTHWCMDALIATFFPVAAAYSKGLPFVFFAGMMVVQLVVVTLYFPETRRVRLEDMEKALGRA
ncbi:MAG: sugar porter family MFS transporter [Steroidobacteraceae bacterium]